jgi:hypothetical protein
MAALQETASPLISAVCAAQYGFCAVVVGVILVTTAGLDWHRTSMADRNFSFEHRQCLKIN